MYIDTHWMSAISKYLSKKAATTRFLECEREWETDREKRSETFFTYCAHIQWHGIYHNGWAKNKRHQAKRLIDRREYIIQGSIANFRFERLISKSCYLSRAAPFTVLSMTMAASVCLLRSSFYLIVVCAFFGYFSSFFYCQFVFMRSPLFFCLFMRPIKVDEYGSEEMENVWYLKCFFARHKMRNEKFDVLFSMDSFFFPWNLC